MYEMGGRKGWQKGRPVEREVTIEDLTAGFLAPIPKEEMVSRSQVPPKRGVRSSNQYTRLGSQTADPWRGGALVGLVGVFVCRQVCCKVPQVVIRVGRCVGGSRLTSSIVVPPPFWGRIMSRMGLIRSVAGLG